MADFTKSYLWKDVDDSNMFHFGVLTIHYKTDTPYFAIWTTCHIDGINELFGEQVYEWAKQLIPGEKKEIILSLGVNKS